ncbi:MAG TPA: CvpA family protein [Acidobacteriaceae bacterium]|jgi:membrane protein required for colicin V production|nr:CvpA family protein [Acidobacteriaceae bacterium]
MAVIDWVIVIVLIVSVLTAAKAGLVVEVFSLAGLILGLLVASWDYQKLMPWIGRWVHSLALEEALSFILIALGIMLVASLAGRLVRWSVKSIGLGWADRLAGAAFGLIKGCALITVAVMVIAAFWPGATWFRQSRFAPGFLSMARHAAVVTPADLGDRIRSGVEVLRKEQPEWLKPAA